MSIVVEELVAADPAIRGMWCVPVFSNPTGAVYSWEVVRRLVQMHRGTGFPVVLGQRLSGAHLTLDFPGRSMCSDCGRRGNPNRPYVFTSTSKITFAAAG